MTEEAAKQNRAFTPDPRPEAGSFYRSDHFSFAKQGVPAVSFQPGRDLVNGGAARGKELADIYTRDKYHQPADEYDPAWNTSSVQGDMTLLYDTGRKLADGAMWPNWSADSEFGAVRAKTAAARK
jgi:Zn-dependent M28 family amino/carboxypeptidase